MLIAEKVQINLSITIEWWQSMPRRWIKEIMTSSEQELHSLELEIGEAIVVHRVNQSIDPRGYGMAQLQ